MTRMATTVVLANRKGGVGKTTTSFNLSACLASMGYKVLAIDFDPQSNLTISFSINIQSLSKSLADVFDNRLSLAEVTLDGVLPNLDLVPTVPEIEKICEDMRILTNPRKNDIIKSKFRGIREAYDFIVMDTPPGRTLLTMNALGVADYVVIPARLDELSTAGLRQMNDLVAEVKVPWINGNIEILGVLATFYENNNDVEAHMKILENSKFSEHLFDTRIRKNCALSASITAGVPVIHFKGRSNGSIDYRAFTTEFLSRIERKAAPIFLQGAVL